MAFESTNAILGVKSLEEQKKSNRWSKWMDIANLLQNTAGMGADIWKTISGRKHDFDLASVGQGYTQSNMQLGLDLDKQLADKNAELAEAKANNDQGRALELEREVARLQAERDKVQQGYAMAQISAEKSPNRSGSEWYDHLNTLKRNIIDEVVVAFGMIGPDGAPTWNMAGQDTKAVADFIKKQYSKYPYLNDGDRAFLDEAFSAYLMGKPLDEPGGVAKTEYDIGSILTGIQNIANRAIAQNPNLSLSRPMSEGEAAVNDPSSFLSNVAGPLAARGYSQAARSWSDQDENALAADLAALAPKITDPADSQSVRDAIGLLQKSGKLDSFEVYDAMRVLRDSVRSLYGKLTAPKSIRDTERP